MKMALVFNPSTLWFAGEERDPLDVVKSPLVYISAPFPSDSFSYRIPNSVATPRVRNVPEHPRMEHSLFPNIPQLASALFWLTFNLLTMSITYESWFSKAEHHENPPALAIADQHGWKKKTRPKIPLKTITSSSPIYYCRSTTDRPK